MSVPIGICQLASDVGTADHDPRPANLDRALRAIDEAADRGARLIVFGEAYLNGYATREWTPRYAVAEDVKDPFVGRLAESAAERDAILIVGATTHKGPNPGDVFNSALVIGPGRLLGVYSKTHVAAFVQDEGGVVAERVYWSPGDRLPVFDTPWGRVGVEVCYDIWFPEVARTLTLKGAELIVNVSAAARGFEASWDHMLWTRSAENAVPYLHVSVVGRQNDVELVGRSRLFGPSGEVLAEAATGSEQVLVTELDRGLIMAARGARHQLTTRNPALYGEIAELPTTPGGQSRA